MTLTQDRLWTVEKYHHKIECGILTAEDRVELLEGRIVEKNPQRPLHAGVTYRTDEYLKILLSDRAMVRVQLPVTLSTSEPEPDIAVVRRDPGTYCDRHPGAKDIYFLIAIADSTLRIDLQEKKLIYAKANIPEYWVLDIVERRAHIFRNPTIQGYQSESVLPDNAVLSPLAFPTVSVSLGELFLP